MTLKKKLMLGGAGLALAAAIPISYNVFVKPKGGHDEPLTVDNPTLRIDFNKKGHPMRVEREGLQAVKLRRDVYKRKKVVAVFRNSGNKPKKLEVDLNKRVVLEDSNHNPITVTFEPPQKHDQIVFDIPAKQFGGCWLSFVDNQCGAKNKDLQLLAVLFTPENSTTESRICFETGEPPPQGKQCPSPNSNNPARAALTFCFVAEPGSPGQSESDCDYKPR